MRRISWAASLCLPLPVDNHTDENGTDTSFSPGQPDIQQPIKRNVMWPI